jgi:hypothetical protein
MLLAAVRKSHQPLARIRLGSRGFSIRTRRCAPRIGLCGRVGVGPSSTRRLE